MRCLFWISFDLREAEDKLPELYALPSLPKALRHRLCISTWISLLAVCCLLTFFSPAVCWQVFSVERFLPQATDPGPYTYDKWGPDACQSARLALVADRSKHAVGNDVVSEPSTLPDRFRTLFADTRMHWHYQCVVIIGSCHHILPQGVVCWLHWPGPRLEAWLGDLLEAFHGEALAPHEAARLHWGKGPCAH